MVTFHDEKILVGKDPPFYNCAFLGVKMCQSFNALAVLEHFFNKHPEITRVLEIGMFTGGLSMYFILRTSIVRGEYMGFEIMGERRKEAVDNIDRLGLSKSNYTVLGDDVFDQDVLDGIRRWVQRDGGCLVFCDGGNKIREFGLIAPYLKSGDFIMTHDWGKEIRDRDVADTVASAGLQEYMSEYFIDELNSYIKCFIKGGN